MSAIKVRSGVTTPELAKKWSYQAMLVPHEMFRMFCDWMQEFVVENDSFDPAEFPWKAVNFSTFWTKYYYPSLHHHHDIEEQIFSPMLKKWGVPIQDETLDDHVPLLKGMDDISAHLKKYRSVSSDLNQLDEWTGALKTMLKAHRELMYKHLDDEEREWCPLIDKHVTQAQYKTLEKKILASLTPEDHKNMLPPIMEAISQWGGPGGVNAFLGELPAYLPPVRGWVKGPWNDRYQTVQRAYLHTLKDSQDPQIIESKPGCCGGGSIQTPPPAAIRSAAEKLKPAAAAAAAPAPLPAPVVVANE